MYLNLLSTVEPEQYKNSIAESCGRIETSLESIASDGRPTKLAHTTRFRFKISYLFYLV